MPTTMDDLGAMYATERHAMVRFLVSRLDQGAEDALQDGMVLAIQNLDRFNGLAKLSTWCNVIAARKGSDSREREAKRPVREARGAIAERVDYPCGLELAELEHIVARTLQMMNPRWQAALAGVMAGRTAAEIAAANGWSLQCVRNYLHLARERMRESLIKAGVL